MAENTCAGEGLSLSETASGPTGALRDQLCQWEQYHMHLLQAPEGHVLQLLPVSTPGGSGAKGQPRFPRPRLPVRLGEGQPRVRPGT